MSFADAMALRERQGWSSTVPPLSPGETHCVWSSPEQVEFMVATDDAPALLEHGVVLNHQHHPVRQVDVIPTMNAVTIRAEGPFRAP